MCHHQLGNVFNIYSLHYILSPRDSDISTSVENLLFMAYETQFLLRLPEISCQKCELL